MNTENLNGILAQYVQHCKARAAADEGTVWRAVDCFGVNWDIEDSDFPAMFADAMQQAQPTLDNPALQPIGGLQNLMLRDSEVELVRECFRWLYNEDGGDISKRRGRAELFADQINGRFRRVFPRMSKYTMNTANAVFFLNLWEPHANYFYQADEAKAWADYFGYEADFGGGTALDLPRYYTMCNDLLHALENYPEIIALHKAYAEQELGGIDATKAMNNETMWYNGPYTMTSYIQGNEKVFTKNPLYWDTECKLFNTVTFKMVESSDVAFQLYQAGDLDYVGLTESALTTIARDPNNEYYDYLVPAVPSKYSYQMHFNYQKNNADGTPDVNWNKAIANTAFRQCFYRGLNLKAWFSRYNKINPLKCENDYYTMKGLCYNTQGVEYTTLVAKEMGFDAEKYDGETMIRLRANGGDISALKKQAMEELSAIGVTFPVHCYHYIKSGDTTALDTATVLKQCFSDSLGDDFVVLDIGTYVSSLYKEVRNVQLHSILQNGWGADFGDPVNFLGQEVLSDDNAYYAQTTSWIAAVEKDPQDYQKELLADYQEFTDLVTEAKAIVTDTDARYAAFAKAEASMLNNALCIPCLYEVLWCLTHVNEYTKINAMYGPCNYKAVNWETSEEAYTTEQYEEFAAAFDAATQA